MRIKILFSFLITLALVGCASQPSVYTDSDPEQDFSVYKTFAWISDSPMTVQSEAVISPLVENRIKNAIRASLESKGYTFVENVAAADMSVGFTIGARDKTRVTQEPVMGSANWRWGGQYWGFGGVGPVFTERTRVYSQGTLAIDVFDTQRQAPVWHGVSSKSLSSEEKAGQEEFVNGAVSVTLENFPTKATQEPTAI
ncbi:DUF4136 domain-containing protein [Ningiella sp. W23]|uniref:DUF4136 domain-containing protein n=1 Tax=Ningiella sp. W23 TaxID=3023715 RepID=UPI00375659F6